MSFAIVTACSSVSKRAAAPPVRSSRAIFICGLASVTLLVRRRCRRAHGASPMMEIVEAVSSTASSHFYSRLIDQRTRPRRLRSYLQLLHRAAQPCFGERIVQLLLDQDAVRADAGLAGCGIGSHGALHGRVQIVRVVEDDEGRIAA